MIKYLNLDNLKNGYSNRPFKPIFKNDFASEVKQALSEIPASVLKKISGSFAGVFLVADLGGTGYTDTILSEKGVPVASFVVLDVNILKARKANEWATWKASTPFVSSDKTYQIQVVIEASKKNNRKNAIQYILLHELGHVLSVSLPVHPHWGYSPSTIKDLSVYKFFNESWLLPPRSKKYVTRFDRSVLKNRSNIVYYFGAKLKNNEIVPMYTNLKKTDFCTLYAATSPFDDWAESFANYVHSVLMKKPFFIKIIKNSKTVESFQSCWGTARCARKEEILKGYFGN